MGTKHLPIIAAAMGVRPSELIDAARAWLDVEITGIINDNHEIIPISNCLARMHKTTTPVPAALGETRAVMVVGNVLSPRYSDGDIITYQLQKHNISNLISRECIVRTIGNRTHIKTILPGSQPGRWHLTSFNGETIFNAEIVDAYPVGWISRTS